MSLTVHQLSRAYGGGFALQEVSFTLETGTAAVLGANGSGKTTLLRLLATLDRPQHGSIQWQGLDYRTHCSQIRRHVGYLPQQLELPGHLSAHRLLHYLGHMRRVAASAVDALIVALAMDGFIDKRLSQLSGGQLRMVGIAQALLGDPDLLVLDELALGLDVIERERVLRRLSRPGRLTLYSTHIPSEAAHNAQSVIVLHQGKVCFCGPVQSLLKSAEGRVYEYMLSPETVATALTSLSVSRVISHGETVQVRVLGESALSGAQPVPPSLEDAYLLLTQR